MGESVDPVDFLRAHPPFDRLGSDALADATRSLEITFTPRGTRILEEGAEPARFLYLVRKGVVRLERKGRVVMEVETGEAFGFPSALAGEPPAFDAVAGEDSLIYRVPVGVLRKLLGHPGVAEFVVHGLDARLRQTLREEESASGGTLSVPVAELVTRDPVWVPADASVADAARRMREERVSSVLVQANPPGIATDRDLRDRVLAEGLGPDTPVREVMSAPLRSLPPESSVHEALVFVMRERVHHLSLARDDRVVGVVTSGDLLRHQTRTPLYLLTWIEKAPPSEVLAGYASEAATAVETLAAGGVDAVEIGRVVATLNDALTQRLIRSAEAELGRPPCRYAWLVLGSEGRLEQLLITDQDNALVYAVASPEADGYFAALAERVVGGLLQAGFPACPGGYMATRHRDSLDAWVQRFRSWISAPEPEALLRAGIFFDFRLVYGTLDLRPLNRVLEEARGEEVFLAHLARAALSHRPPLGMFHRLRQRARGIDVKAHAIAPVVALARLHAIESGTAARSTVERLRSAARAGAIGSARAETLEEAFRFFLRLRLREQLRALRAGMPPGNEISLTSLAPLVRRNLKEAMVAVHDAQEATGTRYQTERLG